MRVIWWLISLMQNLSSTLTNLESNDFICGVLGSCTCFKWSASHVYAFMCAVFTYMVSRWIDLWLDLFVNVQSSNRFLLINPFKTQPQHKNRSGDPLSSAIRLLPSQSWLLRIKSGGERSMSFSASIHPLMRTKVKKHKLFHSVSFVFLAVLIWHFFCFSSIEFIF